MNILIITTKRYYSFVHKFDNKNDEDKIGEWLEFGNSLRKYIFNPKNINENANSIEDYLAAQTDFFATKLDDFDEQELSFWEQDEPNVRILKLQIQDNLVYVLPCIPEFQIESREGLMLNREQRQNYIGCIISDIIESFSSQMPNDCMLYVVAHDKDIFDQSVERVMLPSDLKDQSILGKLIEKNSVSIENIYGYQHSTLSDVNQAYPLILNLLTMHSYENIVDNIIEEIHTSGIIMKQR